MDLEKTYNASQIYKMGMLESFGCNSWPAVLGFLRKVIESGDLKAERKGVEYIIKASDWNAFIENYTASARL